MILGLHHHRPPRPARARLTVALPLAKPTPLPLVPLDRNIGAFLFTAQKSVSKYSHYPSFPHRFLSLRPSKHSARCNAADSTE